MTFFITNAINQKYGHTGRIFECFIQHAKIFSMLISAEHEHFPTIIISVLFQSCTKGKVTFAKLQEPASSSPLVGKAVLSYLSCYTCSTSTSFKSMLCVLWIANNIIRVNTGSKAVQPHYKKSL